MNAFSQHPLLLAAAAFAIASTAGAATVSYSIVPFTYADNLNGSYTDTLSGTIVASSSGTLFGT